MQVNNVKLRFLTKKLLLSLFLQEMFNPKHPSKTQSLGSWVCIILFSSSSLLFMGCMYSQPIHRPVQQPYEQNTQADSVASPELTNKIDSLHIHTDSEVEKSSDTQEPSRKELLLIQAESWEGTPHLWGGTSRSGIDCSALVQHIFAESFDTALPRTTKEQVRVGKKIRPSQLEIGDLVFYRIDRRTRHVGIYMGDHTFLHASKSEGVAISSLDESYWKSRFWMARRILSSESDQAETNTAPKKVQISW